MSIRDRIALAKVLGVAPDDVDYISLIGPTRIANHVRANHVSDMTQDEYNDLVIDIMSPRERNAYDRVIEVISKYGS
ncbi:MAG: hypothetical protein GY841_04395 [FCB group bacterium]|nr:hypothetical protein [FCB group bacterium]